MDYIYNDEDNAPMNDFDFHNPTVYTGIEDIKAMERFPLDEPEEPFNGCWNCRNYDWTREACTIRWNNLDESYYNPDLDDRDFTDYCDEHDLDPDVDPAEWFDYGGNEP